MCLRVLISIHNALLIFVKSNRRYSYIWIGCQKIKLSRREALKVILSDSNKNSMEVVGNFEFSLVVDNS